MFIILQTVGAWSEYLVRNLWLLGLLGHLPELDSLSYTMRRAEELALIRVFARTLQACA